jgi:hypothetical protein
VVVIFKWRNGADARGAVWYWGIRFWGGIVKMIAPLCKVELFLGILPDPMAHGLYLILYGLVMLFCY